MRTALMLFAGFGLGVIGQYALYRLDLHPWIRREQHAMKTVYRRVAK